MRVQHIQCGDFANESERQAFEALKQKLIGQPGNDEWIILSNVSHSFSSQHQSDEIDLLVIGPQGVVVIEVKHWDRTWIKKNQIQVEGEAERLSNKVRRVATTARGRFEYGIALVLASQEAKDFDTSLFSAIANYLILRVIENDAKALARNVAPSDMEWRIADRLKQIDKYQALYFCEGRRNPIHINLTEDVG